MRVSIVPSNQHTNQYAGLPTVTEEKWAAATCAWVQRRLNERGAEAGIFHVPGAGSKSTDELSRSLAQAVAYKPAYMLSVHSDAVGDKRQTGILMLVPWEQDKPVGTALGRAIATNVGLPYKATWAYGNEARKVNYLYTLRLRGIPGSLVEVGEHAMVAEAAWNWHHIREIGVGIADALADYLGLTEEEEDMTDEERTLLKQLRLSALARSYDVIIIKAAIAGDAGEVTRLEVERDAAVATERKRLGL